MYSTLNQSLGKPQLVTWLQARLAGGEGSADDLVRVRRRWACRRWALVGCAWATVVVNYLLLACALWLLRTQPLYRPYAIWRALERPDWRAIGEFARLGVPGGLAVMVEVTSFT